MRWVSVLVLLGTASIASAQGPIGLGPLDVITPIDKKFYEWVKSHRNQKGIDPTSYGWASEVNFVKMSGIWFGCWVFKEYHIKRCELYMPGDTSSSSMNPLGYEFAISDGDPLNVSFYKWVVSNAQDREPEKGTFRVDLSGATYVCSDGQGKESRKCIVIMQR